MKLGLGLYRSLLTDDNFKFAKQAGVTHLVVHLVDYFRGQNPVRASGEPNMGWDITQHQDRPWTEDDLRAIKQRIEANGLAWEAIENFDPAHWYDILLDGPRKEQQLEQLKRTIRMIGRVGIPIMGYNFSLAGVWGWTKGPWGRGGAKALVYDESTIDPQTPMPNGMAWNMVYDPDAPEGTVPRVDTDELWQRYEYFLSRIVPVAEEAGVRMALHPADPPADKARPPATLGSQPQKYQKVFDNAPSPADSIEVWLVSL